MALRRVYWGAGSGDILIIIDLQCERSNYYFIVNHTKSRLVSLKGQDASLLHMPSDSVRLTGVVI